MASTNQDDIFYAKNKRQIVFTVTNSNVDGNPPLDLTGWSAKWSMSRLSNGVYSATPKLEKTIGSGIEVTDAVNGVLVVSIEPEDTQELLGFFHHQLEVFDGDGKGVIVSTGKFQILKNIIETESP